ncbi:MAG TPA: hypothetical protein VND65_16275 [Candidatus Binatia bacterium]|nr:hypothetical protein [Candidatus Binatia bacterium]
MRPLLALICFTLVAPMTAGPSPFPADAETSVTLYDPNPAHIWNRLDAALFVRQAPGGAVYGHDSLDPLLWGFSTQLLEPKSHRRALRVLDEFLQSHAENLVRDPVSHAVLQRDLWAVFDWSVARQPDHLGEPTYDPEKRELQIRLVEVLRRLALTPKEIEALPDNYAQAVASREFAGAYDPAQPDRAFLPPDLLDSRGPWVWLPSWDPPYQSSEPAALQHVEFFSGRSRFLIFIRLPAGRKATYDYLREVWNFPEPWVAESGAAPANARYQTDLNPALPSFPAGTEVALVRQMNLIDNQGNLVPAPITESVQIRVYRSVTGENSPPEGGFEEAIQRSGQDCYEIRLSRPKLFSGTSGGLRAIARGEKDFFIFDAMGFDQVDDPNVPIRWSQMPAVTKSCISCHRGVGLASVNSRHNLVKPNSLAKDDGGNYPPRWWENDGTTAWKGDRYDWLLLRSYWGTLSPTREQ